MNSANGKQSQPACMRVESWWLRMVSINNNWHCDIPAFLISTWMSTERWIRNSQYLLHSAAMAWQLRHAFAVAPWSRKWRRRTPHVSQQVPCRLLGKSCLSNIQLGPGTYKFPHLWIASKGNASNMMRWKPKCIGACKHEALISLPWKSSGYRDKHLSWSRDKCRNIGSIHYPLFCWWPMSKQ
jgi:hypothetical protein